MKYWLFMFCILLISCSKQNHQPNEITKVELARSGAWSDFGATISIDSALNYKYYGDCGTIRQGYFTGKVDRKLWDSITRKLEQLKFRTLPITDSAFVVDVNYFELIIHWKNRERRILRIEKYPSDSLFSVIKWIDTGYRKVKLHQVKDSFKFESNYHRKPIHIVDQVKFPPPIDENFKKRGEN